MMERLDDFEKLLNQTATFAFGPWGQTDFISYVHNVLERAVKRSNSLPFLENRHAREFVTLALEAVAVVGIGRPVMMY